MFRKEKESTVEELTKLVNEYPVVGIVDINKLPAAPLQRIKNGLREKALIRVSKRSLIKMAFEKSSKDLKKLLDIDVIQPALILTKENPFKIVNHLNKNKSPAPAKAGDIAQDDIVVSAGVTDFPPGPAISSFKKVGLKTGVEAGKIKVLADKVICKKGEKITPDMAQIFSMLKMKPMKIGLNVAAMWEDGVVYEKSVLEIDESEYLDKLKLGFTHALNLSIEIGYPTKENIEILIVKAFLNAKELAIEAALPEKDVIEDILARASSEAKILKDAAEK